jgi:hypothetical protein
MGSGFLEIKKNGLETRLDSLKGQYIAVNKQLVHALDAADTVKLEAKLAHLELDIRELEKQLKELTQQGKDKSTAGELSRDDIPLNSGRRWSVLVGVNEYDDRLNYSPLTVCVKDVNAIHQHLIANKYDPNYISLITDNTDEPPSRENILTALQASANAAEQDDLLLFYYSGHGDVDENESYLVARNGHLVNLRDTAVSLARVVEIMQSSAARAKVIILDACHSGVDIGGKKGAPPMPPEFISRVFEQAEGLAILASCKQGQLSYEWGIRERSVFTNYLLEALSGKADRDDKGFVTVQDVNRHVTNGVKLWASQHRTSQTPTLEYRVSGDIILVDLR